MADTWAIQKIKIIAENPTFAPPSPNTGGGLPDGEPSGESCMITIKRLVAAANGRIWYENIGGV